MTIQTIMVLVFSFAIFDILCVGSLLWVIILTMLNGLCGMCFGKYPSRTKLVVIVEAVRIWLLVEKGIFVLIAEVPLRTTHLLVQWSMNMNISPEVKNEWSFSSVPPYAPRLVTLRHGTASIYFTFSTNSFPRQQHFCFLFSGFVVSSLCDTELTATYFGMGSFLPILMLCGE